MDSSIFQDYKILILVESGAGGLRTFFAARGFQVSLVDSSIGPLKQVLDEKPHVVIMNLLTDRVNACDFCRKVYRIDPKIQTKIIVVSRLREKENVVGAINSGAADYVLIPFENETLLNRVKYHLRRIRVIESRQMVDVLHDERVEIIFGVLDLLAKGLDPHETLYNVAFRLEKLIPLKRASIIAGGQFTDVGFVAATNDDSEFQRFRLDLQKYPEVQQVIHTGKTVVIEDIRNDPMMKDIKKKLTNIDFNSMIVAPIIYRDSPIGVLSVRAMEETKIFSEEEIRFCQLLSIAAAPPLNSWRFLNRELISRA